MKDSPPPPKSNRCIVACCNWVDDSVPVDRHYCSHRRHFNITTIDTDDSQWNTVNKVKAEAASYQEELAGNAEASRQ